MINATESQNLIVYKYWQLFFKHIQSFRHATTH